LEFILNLNVALLHHKFLFQSLFSLISKLYFVIYFKHKDAHNQIILKCFHN